jgi:exonuclease III
MQRDDAACDFRGDFNLIRDLSDKSTVVGDQRLIDAFNSFIENHHLREIHRVGPKFTWTNKQSNPVMSNIDIIVASTEWDLKFPTSCLNTLTRVGSDHCPLLLDTGGF